MIFIVKAGTIFTMKIFLKPHINWGVFGVDNVSIFCEIFNQVLAVSSDFNDEHSGRYRPAERTAERGRY